MSKGRDHITSYFYYIAIYLNSCKIGKDICINLNLKQSLRC
jgi:hypothetical protein